MSQIISTLLDKEDSPLMLKYSSNKFTTFLETGIESKVKIAEDIFLYTNRLFTTKTKPYRVPIVSQKPDIILEIASSRALIILDAKYRLGVYAIRNGQGLEKLSYGNLITEDFLANEILYFANDEDINVIHRYRDAIYLNNPEDFKHVVIKGIIIFPGILSPESLEEAKQTYERFNISCLPLIPGEPDLTWKTASGYDFNDLPENDATTERIRSIAEVLKSLLPAE